MNNDKEEIIDLAKSEGIIDYECETLNQARLKEENIEILEEEHSSIGFYVIQPDDQQWNNR